MSLTYESAGVNKNEGYAEVNLIKGFIKNTYTPGVLSDLGGFSGLFEIDKSKYENPVLVSGTDGVGTKVMLAQMLDKHDTVGIDCVAMCVNDILCQGAKPLFFLDYIATGKLVAEKMASIVEGVAKGCIDSGAALIGGETAEMPGMYSEKDYDLAGFCVGIVDKDKIIDGKKNVKEGDIILALPSSGLHSNGFSLVRKIIFEHKKLDVQSELLDGKTLAEVLLTPTRIYVKDVLKIMERYRINAMSHITGGGLYENVPRVLPENLDAVIEADEIPEQKIFSKLREWGDLDKEEMYGTFNMGVGLVMVIDKKDAEGIKAMKPEIIELGKIVKGSGKVILNTGVNNNG